MRLFLAAVSSLVVCAPAAQAYPWPLRPFNQAHPIRANFGDPRTWCSSTSRLSASRGTQSVQLSRMGSYRRTGRDAGLSGSGRHLLHYLTPTWIAVRAFGAEYRYIHIHPIVFEGQRVYKSRTVLGYVEPWAGHLHFSELHGRAVNPLQRGHLTPYTDRTRPTVTEPSCPEPDGQSVERPFRICGRVRSPRSRRTRRRCRSPATGPASPVAPAIVSWTLREHNGSKPSCPARRRELSPGPAAEFDVLGCLLRAARSQNSARAAATRLALRLQGRFLFVLSPNFDASQTHEWHYALTVTAQDARGNQDTLSEAILIVNGSPRLH